MVLENAQYARELEESGTCPRPTIGVFFVKAQVYVLRVEVKVGMNAENVEVKGFSHIGYTISQEPPSSFRLSV